MMAAMSIDSSTKEETARGNGGKFANSAKEAAEARNSMLSEIKALQVKRQGSFKRMFNNNSLPANTFAGTAGRGRSDQRPPLLKRSSRSVDEDHEIKGKEN